MKRFGKAREKKTSKISSIKYADTRDERSFIIKYTIHVSGGTINHKHRSIDRSSNN